MKPFSKAIGKIGTENAFAVGPEISGWMKKGYDITKLTIGEPGCDIAKSATKAAIDSFKKRETHYTPSSGLESLREKIAKYMSLTRGMDFGPEDVVLAPGGKPVIAGAISILVDPGDEVIYPTPCYPIYESMVDFIGAKSKPIELKEERGFRFEIEDLEKLITKKTKLLILNSPSNPTGGVLEEEDLKKIAILAKKHDFYVLSDEIYSRMVYGDKFRQVKYKDSRLPIAPSIASQPGMGKRTIILDGFSKTYAMTGLRVGFACSKNKAFLDKFLTYGINIWSCLPKPCMAAAEAVLGPDQTETQREMKLYEKKRDVAVKMLNRIKGIKCHNPVGAFYLFPNVTEVCKELKFKDAEVLRKYLLTFDEKGKRGVAVLTRNHFGKRLKSENQEYIRLSFAGSLSSLKEGIKRIGEAIDEKINDET